MRKLPIIILALVAPLLAQAQDAAPAAPAQPGDETRAWLQLQASGAAAVPEAAPMSGEVADKVYQRYLKSFDHPIPEHFRREGFASGGGSSQ